MPFLPPNQQRQSTEGVIQICLLLLLVCLCMSAFDNFLLNECDDDDDDILRERERERERESVTRDGAVGWAGGAGELRSDVQRPRRRLSDRVGRRACRQRRVRQTPDDPLLGRRLDERRARGRRLLPARLQRRSHRPVRVRPGAGASGDGAARREARVRRRLQVRRTDVLGQQRRRQLRRRLPRH